MNLFMSIIVIFMVLTMIMKQIPYMKKLKIPTKKTVFETIVYLAAILIIIVITLLYGKALIHYLVGTLGIALFTIEFLKQGIFEDGILILARGKEIYRWNEILNVQIVKSSYVKVTYWGREGLSITHKFAIERYEEIVGLFIKNNINYDIKYNK